GIAAGGITAIVLTLIFPPEKQYFTGGGKIITAAVSPLSPFPP
ncbi:hypothetical protein, partial [Klebsiella pneumoniae]